MQTTELQDKVSNLVKEKCSGINPRQITAKDFTQIKKAFTSSVAETFALEKSPRVKDFGLDPATGEISGSFQVPVTFKVQLPNKSQNEAPQATTTEA